MSEMTKFGADLIQAMSGALAHAQGKDVPGSKVHTVDVGAVDAKAIRKKLALTQDEMAIVLGTSPSGYKKMAAGHPAAERRGANTTSCDGSGTGSRVACPVVS